MKKPSILFILLGLTAPNLGAQVTPTFAHHDVKEVVAEVTITADTTRPKWNEGDKMKNFYACVGEASKLTSESKARKYCSCVLEQAQAKFPDPQDYEILAKQGQKVLLEVMGDEIIACTQQHITDPKDVTTTEIEWTASAEAIFKNHCINQLQADAPQLNADAYCSCMTEKMKYRFPYYNEFIKKSFNKEEFAQEIRTESTECLQNALK